MGLDSLYFQNELITKEHNNQKELFIFINNRIYCEYYKLYHMITDYVNKEIQCPELSNKLTSSTNFPKYKSLDPLKEYDFDFVNKLYTHIVNVISNLNAHVEVQSNELLADTRRIKMGLNIDNVVHSQTFLHSILKEKIKMFVQYLKTFQHHHIKYLTRLSSKIKLVLNIIKDDISLQKTKEDKTDENVKDSMAGNSAESKIVFNVIDNIIDTIEEKENKNDKDK